MGIIQLDLLRGNIITIIMIAKIALVSMLAAVAVAAPEPQIPYGLGYAGGAVASHVPPACTPSTEEIEIQTSAPPLMLSPRKSPTKRDAKRLSTNTALESSGTLDLSSNVKLKLKLMLKSLLVFPSLTVLPLMLMLLSPPPLP